ncbi:hypothetical protein BHM03_00026099 [Ensete ventricosum]|nr:hypothetical protein BHM03_00026099 [Ensete ventricosum]
MPLSLSVLSMANSTLKNTLTAAKLSTESNNEGLLGHMMEVVTGSQKMNATGLDDISNGVGRSISADLFKGTVIGSSHLSDVTTLAVGYMFIFCFVIFYLGLLALIRYSRAVGWALGLTDYLLPPPEENGTQDAGNIELVRRDRLHNVRQGGAGRNDQPLIPRIVGEDHQGRRVIVGDADAAEESDVDDQADSETHRVPVLLLQIWKWCAIILKSSALLSIWVILDQMAPLVDENWRRKFERVREDGFSRLRGLWVLREIMIPIISKLLTALCIPYVFAKGVFPVFGYPLIVNSAVYRFAWLGCLVFSLVCFCARRFNVWFTNLHNSIRDDRYLVGRRLHNYGDITSESETGPHDQELNSTEEPGLIHREQDAGLGLRFRRGNQFPNQRGRQML